MTIPKPRLKNAVRLTPQEMNNLHFRRPGTHSIIPARQAKPNNRRSAAPGDAR